MPAIPTRIQFPIGILVSRVLALFRAALQDVLERALCGTETLANKTSDRAHLCRGQCSHLNTKGVPEKTDPRGRYDFQSRTVVAGLTSGEDVHFRPRRTQ